VATLTLRQLPPTPGDIKAWQRVVGATEDGDPGPETQRLTIEWLRARGHLMPPAIVPETRSRVVAIARAELGEQDPQKYIRDAAPIYIGQPPNAKAWCGIFALWCYRKAGLTTKQWIDGRGFAHGYLPIVSLPEPGDLAYYSSGQHYAIVEHCADGYVYTIDGNAMKAPKEGVDTRRRWITDAAAYYSIRNLT
jgi:hypothetical protein